MCSILLAKIEKRAEAEKILADVKDGAKKGRIPNCYFMASLCFALDDRNQGSAYLDQAYDEAHDQGYNWAWPIKD